MADTMEEIRRKAASAVMALGQRSAAKGRLEADGKPKPGWIPSPSDPARGYILPDKLREALAYYDIAIAIVAPGDPNGAFAVYTKALLLEELGDYAEAEAVFRSLEGTRYANPARLGLKRCAQHRAGAHEPHAEMRAGFEQLAQAMQGQAGAADFLAAMRHVQDTLAGRPDTRHVAPSSPAASPAAAGDNDDEDAAAALAQRFVDLLLDRDYAAARQLLHADLAALSIGDLRRRFEALFTDEPFPETAHVLDAMRTWPDKRAEDVASFYVTIDSEQAEAVSVIVTRDGQALKVREIEWGRP